MLRLHNNHSETWRHKAKQKQWEQKVPFIYGLFEFYDLNASEYVSLWLLCVKPRTADKSNIFT